LLPPEMRYAARRAVRLPLLLPLLPPSVAAMFVVASAFMSYATAHMPQHMPSRRAAATSSQIAAVPLRRCYSALQCYRRRLQRLPPLRETACCLTACREVWPCCGSALPSRPRSVACRPPASAPSPSLPPSSSSLSLSLPPSSSSSSLPPPTFLPSSLLSQWRRRRDPVCRV